MASNDTSATSTNAMNPGANLIHSADEWSRMARSHGAGMNSGPPMKSVTTMLALMDSLHPFSAATAILDNGCGTGSFTNAFLSAHGATLPPSARLYAADFSQGMVDVLAAARDREVAAAAAEGAVSPWSRLQTVVADAQDLSPHFPAGTLSHVAANMVYFLVPEPARALAESVRALAPGGVSAFSTFARVDWQECLVEAARSVRPDVAAGVGLPEEWKTVEGVRRVAEGAGLVDVRVESVESLMEVSEGMAAFFVKGDMPASKGVVSGFKPEELDRVCEEFLRLAREKYCEVPGKLKGVGLVVAGRKP